ncbi:hypothetical protein B0H24_100727 [Marinobacter persicus]|uniref:Uncharacterized protein n=1 Tax=Marinobacter persicus TaxID=930118 RepID=A0A2S6G7S0_9GAMM|nr:hypothetical protein B0H24_100727 [Marinobacter persicus]
MIFFISDTARGLVDLRAANWILHPHHTFAYKPLVEGPA